jgi:hypothetical protein
MREAERTLAVQMKRVRLKRRMKQARTKRGLKTLLRSVPDRAP